jgi:hypothetical protein
MVDPNDNGVNESESQTGDQEPIASEQAESQPAERAERSERRDRDDVPRAKGSNAIPHDRVEQMITQRIAKERASWEEQHLNPLKKQFEENMGRVTQGQLAWAKAMGWYEDPKPKTITQEDLEARLTAMEQKRQQESVYQYHSTRINEGWESISEKYPKLKENMQFRRLVLAEYAENPRSMIKIGDEMAKVFVAAMNAEKRVEQESRNRPDRKVVSSGRGAGGGAGAKGEAKQGVADRIKARLQASRSDD